jgi:hypothetical protein
MTTLAERLAQKTGTPTATGCAPWLGARLPTGYGTLHYEGRKEMAHRLAWRVVHGPIPEGLVVRHVVCRNPACVNVAHLAIGTQADNMADRTRDWVAMHGVAMPGAKLTEADVRAIRASAESQRTLAKRYGVSQPAIGYIRIRKTWKHVP